jgi:hypothetical protein
MGFKKSDGSKKTFANVADGKFKVKAKEGDALAFERINKEGNKVWEFLYPELEGYITNVEKKSFTYQGNVIDQLAITVDDGDELYEVQCVLGSSPCQSFLARAENIDFTQPVTLSAFEYTTIVNGDERTNTYLIPKQHGEKMIAVYGREEDGCAKQWPALKEVTINKKKAWDKSDRIDEFERVIDRVKVMILSKPANAAPAVAETRYDKVGASVASASAPGKYNPTTDFDTPSPIAEQANEEDDDYSSDLPF